MKQLIIVGASGFGREVAWLIERINKLEPTWEILGFMDDKDELQGKVINGYKVIGKVPEFQLYPEAFFICAVGSSMIREKIINNMVSINPNVRFGTVIDPSVEISKFVTIGEGSIICAHNIITVNIEIGSHVIINLDCTVGHDAIIHDYATLYPSVNVSGITTIGRCSEIGTGAQIIQTKSIGDYSIVGAGAIVVDDIPARCVAVGCPAKPIKYI